MVSRRFGVVFGRFGMFWSGLGCFHGPYYFVRQNFVIIYSSIGVSYISANRFATTWEAMSCLSKKAI